MTPDRNNFYFRHTKGDAVSERAVKMLNVSGKQRYYGKIGGGMEWSSEIDYFTAEKIPFISPQEAIRLMEGGEVETDYISESAWPDPSKQGEVSTNQIALTVIETALSKMDHDLNCASRIRCIPIRKCDCFKSGIEEILEKFKTPAPPTAEQELHGLLKDEITAYLWGRNLTNVTETVEKVLAVSIPIIISWHAKHQPKEVEVTDCEILNMYAAFGSSKQTEDYEDIIALVRWALARAKGKDV